jgi:mono/diheme cytochrome c family protein
VYLLTLTVHSTLRWVVLALLVAFLARAGLGWARGRAAGRGDERLHRALAGAIDAQLLLGLLLLVLLSPFARGFFADPGSAMKSSALRFFGLEHGLAMVVAVGLVHAARGRTLRHRRAFLCTLAAALLVAGSIPWPFLPYGRPLLRSPGAAPAAERCPESYAARCAACHGPRGRGDGFAASSLRPPPRDFADPAWRDDRVAAVIRDGGAAHGLSPAMPSHRDLSAKELEALAECVRTLRSAPRPAGLQ